MDALMVLGSVKVYASPEQYSLALTLASPTWRLNPRSIPMTPTSLPALALSCLLCLTAFLAGCGNQQEPSTAAPSPATSEQSKGTEPIMEKSVDVAAKKAAEAAIANPARPAEDLEADERRHALAVLEFSEIAPGKTVLEMEAGSGYFTELFSYTVGDTGQIYMQNPASFDAFLGDAVTKRLADNRLANVRLSKTQFDALEPDTATIDVVTWFQGPHELYYEPEGGKLGDVPSTYAEIFRVLKPGGAFLVLDHSAEEGAPTETGNTLHRLHKSHVSELAKAAGFVLEAESDVLANPEDPLNISVFAPAIRGRTDQYLLRFRKPA